MSPDGDPADTVHINIECDRALRQRLKKAAIEDGDLTYAEEIRQLLDFRDRHQQKFRRADLGRDRRRKR